MNRTMATMGAAALALMLSACSGGDGQTPQTDTQPPGSTMDRDTMSTPQTTMPEESAPDTGSTFGDGQTGSDMNTPPPASGSQP